MLKAKDANKVTTSKINDFAKKQMKEVEKLISEYANKGVYYCYYEQTLYPQVKAALKKCDYSLTEHNNQIKIDWSYGETSKTSAESITSTINSDTIKTSKNSKKVVSSTTINNSSVSRYDKALYNKLREYEDSIGRKLTLADIQDKHFISKIKGVGVYKKNLILKNTNKYLIN